MFLAGPARALFTLIVTEPFAVEAKDVLSFRLCFDRFLAQAKIGFEIAAHPVPSGGVGV